MGGHNLCKCCVWVSQTSCVLFKKSSGEKKKTLWQCHAGEKCHLRASFRARLCKHVHVVTHTRHSLALKDLVTLSPASVSHLSPSYPTCLVFFSQLIKKNKRVLCPNLSETSHSYYSENRDDSNNKKVLAILELHRKKIAHT